MRKLASEPVTTNSFFPEGSALLGSVTSFREVKVLGEFVETVGKLALVLIRAIAIFRVVFAELSLVFTNVGFNGSIGGLFITTFIIGGLGFGAVSVGVKIGKFCD